ncbi:MAG: dTMP kinase, partial [Actinomycetota bacterium]
GRTFSAAYTAIRLGTLLGLGLFPFVAGAIGDNVFDQAGFRVELPGTRVTLWLAGGFVISGGLYSMRAIKERWRGGRSGRERGFFVVFEGGEGAGKSTQIEAFTRWLQDQGEQVVQTREPGGTEIGAKIRLILLDPAIDEMDERTEALLYAADRAQHVSEVIKPSLDEGKIVVSDRFVDSSLAYQGLARGLGLDRIYRLSEWATGGLLPDIVFYLKLDPGEGLRRVGDDRDRIEKEDGDFHLRVGAAYLELARRYPGRFVVLDASKDPEEVKKDVIEAFQDRARHLVSPLGSDPSFGPSGPVVR